MVLMTVYIGEVAEVQLLGCSYQSIQTLPMKYINKLEKGIRINTHCRWLLKAELMVGRCSCSKAETFIKQMLTAIWHNQQGKKSIHGGAQPCRSGCVDAECRKRASLLFLRGWAGLGWEMKEAGAELAAPAATSAYAVDEEGCWSFWSWQHLLPLTLSLPRRRRRRWLQRPRPGSSRPPVISLRQEISAPVWIFCQHGKHPRQINNHSGF